MESESQILLFGRYSSGMLCVVDTVLALNFQQFKELTNKLLQPLLFQMSLLPVCVLSLLPCGAPQGRPSPAVASGSEGCVKSLQCSPVTQHSREQPTKLGRAKPGGPGPAHCRAGGSPWNMPRAQVSSRAGDTALPTLIPMIL